MNVQPVPTLSDRLADGPDEVHKVLIAKNVLSRYQAGHGWDFGS